MTGSGTCIEVSEIRCPLVKVSPLAQSTPNRATMSPASASVMSSIWLACMRPRRPTFTFRPVRRVEEGVALLQLPLVETHVGELAVRAVLQLEGVRHQRVGGEIGEREEPLLVVGQVARLVRHLGGIGQQPHDAVEQQLHAPVLVGAAEEHRRDLALQRPLAQRGPDHLLRDAILEHRLRQLVAEHRGGVQQDLAPRLGLVPQRRRDLLPDQLSRRARPGNGRRACGSDR